MYVICNISTPRFHPCTLLVALHAIVIVMPPSKEVKSDESVTYLHRVFEKKRNQNHYLGGDGEHSTKHDDYTAPQNQGVTRHSWKGLLDK